MTKKLRRDPNLTEKLAAALLIIADLKGEGIPFDHAKGMHPEQICSLFQWDHANFYVNGGTTHPTNLTPRWIAEHREKTAKNDVPQIRKGDRLSKAHKEFRAKLLAKTGQGEAPEKRATRWPKQKIQNGGKIQSRSTFKSAGKRAKA